MTRDEAQAHFASRFRAVVTNPNAYWAKRNGLTYAAVRDLVQGRSLPSRAMVILLVAAEMDAALLEMLATRARSSLALLDTVKADAAKR